MTNIEKGDKRTERPRYYRYAEILSEYLFSKKPKFTPFGFNPILPRQLEVHVPNRSQKPCNLHCIHCQGNRVDKSMGMFNDTLLSLFQDVSKSIPLFVFSGAYTEPTLNNNLLEFIETTKIGGANFGVHTNGTLMTRLEKEYAFIDRLSEISNSNDYITIALDAGSAESFAKIKGVDANLFDDVIDGLELLVSMTKKKRHPCLKIRITYLLNEWNSSEFEITSAITICQRLEVDSLRFSIPYTPYGTPYETCIRYKYDYEIPFSQKIEDRIRCYISTNLNKKPSILFLPPVFQDVEDCFMHHCFYGYFQLTVGADGYLYRCSSTASPTFVRHRLGKVPNNTAELLEMTGRNQDITFDPLIQCKPYGARCNRAAIEVNRVFEKRWFGVE